MEIVQEARGYIEQADALLITAGAGMGVDSGLPDFRGDEGFWNAYPPMRQLGISFSQMANPEWFEKDPEFAWGFYGHRLNLYRDTTPHKGFQQLLEYGKNLKGGLFVFTSNVDGQFQKAAFPEESMLECHGSIHHLQCFKDCQGEIWNMDETVIEVDSESFRARSPLPTCPYCGGLARPNIMMFGDWGFNAYRTSTQEEAFESWLRQLATQNLTPLIIEVGAGESVPTVRMLSERVAASFNGTLIRINPRDSDLPDNMGVSLEMGGLEGILALLDS